MPVWRRPKYNPKSKQTSGDPVIEPKDATQGQSAGALGARCKGERVRASPLERLEGGEGRSIDVHLGRFVSHHAPFPIYWRAIVWQ